MGDRITVVGTGMWGTTLAIILARKGLSVRLWARTDQGAALLKRDGENKLRLPGIPFPRELGITVSLDEALGSAQLVIVAVPSNSMRENIIRIRPFLTSDAILLSATKGLEVGTAKRMSEVVGEEVPSDFHHHICVLSGPNLAREIAKGLPASTVVASENEEAARFVQGKLMLPTLRVYTNRDVVGVEMGGALKNIIAIGAGACDGFGYGDNAKAAFITRGLAEITRLAVAMGGNPLTLGGLTGLGDLVATCASPYSRNRFVGEQLAKGKKLPEIQASMVSVAEGVQTTAAARSLAQRLQVEMPITEQTYQVLFEGKSPLQALQDLMGRPGKSELAGLDDRR